MKNDKKVQTILFAGLIATMILPFSMINYAEASVIDDELLIHQYNNIFGDNNTSDDIKIRVINSMINSEVIELVQPKYQDLYANQVLEILEQIRNSDDGNEKQQLKEQLDEKQERLLEVGIVLADAYKLDPYFWDLELDRTANSSERNEIKREKNDNIRQITYDDGSSKITFVSGDPFKSTIYQKFWCHNGLLLCTSTTYNKNMDYGELWSAQYTLGNEAWYGQVIPYHKVKNISDSYQSGIDIGSWISIQSHSDWVDSCHDENTFNFSPSKTHYWSICNSQYSNSGNVIYHTLFID